MERHSSSRQPVNQALNTPTIRGDYQTGIVPKGESTVTESWTLSQSERRGGWMLQNEVLVTLGGEDTLLSAFCCRNNFSSITTGNI